MSITLLAPANVMELDLPGGIVTVDSATGSVSVPIADVLPALNAGCSFPADVPGGVSGLLKGFGGTVVAATSGTDYAPAAPVTTRLLKGNGAGGSAITTAAVDYAPATTGTSILKASSGGFGITTAGVDYAPATTGTAYLKALSGGFTAHWPAAVVGTRSDGTALTSLLSVLASYGFISDSTVP